MGIEGGNIGRYNPVIHQRRSIRLKGYDYSQPGAYFVTICVCEKNQPLFGEVVDGKMRLSHMGEIVWKCWNRLPKHYPNIRLDEFVVMPDHVHGIIWLISGDGRTIGAGLQKSCTKDVKPARTADASHGANVFDAVCGEKDEGGYIGGRIYPLSEVIRGFKTFSARRINELRGKAGVPVWQRNYWEHIIRNETSRIREYIINNPVRWKGWESDKLRGKAPYRGHR